MQKTSIEEKVKSLEEAVERYADVLREDREKTMELRRQAVTVATKDWPAGRAWALAALADAGPDDLSLQDWINGWKASRTRVDLASLRATKPADQNTHFFIDFLTGTAFATARTSREPTGELILQDNGIFIALHSFFAIFPGVLRRLLARSRPLPLPV